MSQPTHPLLSLVESNRNGLKSMLTSYIDATVDSQFASLKDSILTMIQGGQIGHYSDNALPYTQTTFSTGHSNIDPSISSSILHDSNDQSTILHQQITLPSSSLMNPITTSAVIKQEYLEESSATIPTNFDSNFTQNDIDNDRLVQAQSNNNLTNHNEDEDRVCDCKDCLHEIKEEDEGENDEIADGNSGLDGTNDSADIDVDTGVDTQIGLDENKIEDLPNAILEQTPMNIPDVIDDSNQSAHNANDLSLINESEQQIRSVRNQSVEIHQPSTFIPQPSTSSHFNSQFINMNYPHHQPNGPIHLDSISNLQLSQSQSMPIKEEIETTTNEPMPTHQVQSCSYGPVSNEQSKHNLTDKIWNDNDECVGGGVGVKEEDEDDQMDRESSRPVKKPRIDPTQPNNAQADVTRQRQPTDEAQSNEDRMESEQSEAIDTRATIGEYSQPNSNESMVIQQQERDSNNAIGEEIATECTTNPIQPNLAQPNRHLQCSHCLKSFYCNSSLQTHLRVHTGERPFQCNQCGKRFNLYGNLTKHKLIHQNIKSFRCHFCEKQFTQKHSLDTHLRTHSGERPFKCRHCEMSFFTSNNKKKHEQAKHLHVKPYRCKQCGHTTTQRSDVIIHIRMVHFRLPRTAKEQRELNIIDDRDPKELVEKV